MERVYLMLFGGANIHDWLNCKLDDRSQRGEILDNAIHEFGGVWIHGLAWSLDKVCFCNNDTAFFAKLCQIKEGFVHSDLCSRGSDAHETCNYRNFMTCMAEIWNSISRTPIDNLFSGMTFVTLSWEVPLTFSESRLWNIYIAWRRRSNRYCKLAWCNATGIVLSSQTRLVKRSPALCVHDLLVFIHCLGGGWLLRIGLTCN